MASVVPILDQSGRTDIAIFRESTPLRSTTANIPSASYTNGQFVTGVGPTPTQLLWVQKASILSSVDTQVDFFANGGGPTVGYTFMSDRMGLKAGVTEIVDVGLWLPEGQTIGLVAAQNFTAAISFGITGFRITNDLNYGANKVILHIGDSISNTIGATYLEGFHHGIFRDYLKDQGVNCRLVIKGNGGYTSSNIDYLRASDQLNIPQADLIIYEIGTNDNVIPTFQANFDKVIPWKRRNYPNATMIILGSVQYAAVPAQETNLVAFRAYEQAAVAAAAPEDKVYFLSYAGLLTPTTADYLADLIHPNATGQAKMGQALIDFYVNNNLSI